MNFSKQTVFFFSSSSSFHTQQTFVNTGFFTPMPFAVLRSSQCQGSDAAFVLLCSTGKNTKRSQRNLTPQVRKQ